MSRLTYQRRVRAGKTYVTWKENHRDNRSKRERRTRCEGRGSDLLREEGNNKPKELLLRLNKVIRWTDIFFATAKLVRKTSYWPRQQQLRFLNHSRGSDLNLDKSAVIRMRLARKKSRTGVGTRCVCMCVCVCVCFEGGE